MRRKIFSLISLLATLIVASAAVTPYETLALKAERFFGFGEWSSASAMYTLMLEQRADDPDVFGHAIVAAGMLDEPGLQNHLLTQALNARQPIDSVLQATERASFSIGQTSLYEHFLLTVKEHEPWLNRVVDSYLLNYYTFRDNGPGIVTMSKVMLAGLPDNERFLYSLAHGQLLCGDIESAIVTYRRIVDLNPEAYDALLYLGNYLIGSASTADEGRSFLRRAQAINPTPRVGSLLGDM